MFPQQDLATPVATFIEKFEQLQGVTRNFGYSYLPTVGVAVSVIDIANRVCDKYRIATT